MEAVLKAQENISDYIEQPDLDRAEYREFRFHFQKSILLSLLAGGSLTQQQYDLCMEKLAFKYARPQPAVFLASRQENAVKYEERLPDQEGRC